jgi:ABC-type transport system substrate-binding protein
MISSGQYVLTDWSPGASEWALEENPNFFGGPSMVKRVEFVAVPDQTSRTLQLVTGALDYGYDIPASARTSLPEEVGTFVVPLNGMYYIAIYLPTAKDGPLGNPKVRQAISLAVDRQAIQDRAFFGISPAADTFLYKGPPEGLANLPNGGKRDVEAAKQLLAEAGYPGGGFGFTIQPWGQRPGWTDAATIIKENLAEVGIEVTVDPKTDVDAIANANAGSYETQFTGNVGDPMTYFSQLFVPGGLWYRWIGYDNPQVTDLVTRAGSSLSPEERVELLHQMQELLAEEMPYIPISERVVLVASRIPRNILCEANLGTGYNPTIATVQEYTSGTGPCK